MAEDVAPYRDRVMAFYEWECVGGFGVGVVDGGGALAEIPFPERGLAAFAGQEQVVLEEAERLRETGLYKKSTDQFFKELEKARPELMPLFLDATAER
ncbi:hypothetical protein ACFYWX_28430 [Streptomyces sp. NPDC002888]|uniref:hypothetical protein n=1 Tax=Streptomyces sp. NPDC002888 TaxID=3364668 RepID=UPI0036B890BC